MERKAISSDRSISSHKPEDKKYFVPVKNHPKLFLMVRPTETKSWMYRYYPPSNPKQSIISIGIYPSISYARACEVQREYEDLLSKGIDPKTYREYIKKSVISKTKNYFNHFA